MNIIDISWPLVQDVTTYKDEDPLNISEIADFETDQMRLSLLNIMSHTGTHIDAPSHFLADGKTIDQLPLESLIGTCQVLDCTGTDVISAPQLEQFTVNSGDIILFKTNNSSLPATGPFKRDFVYCDESAAQWCVSKKIKAVGIDYLGIEADQPGHPTHKRFMQEDIPIIEGLRLAHVEPGRYTLICLPLAVKGLEAAPARAILVDHL